MNVYLLKADGGHAGPYSVDQINSMLAFGTVTPETPSWAEGMSEWQPLKKLFARPSTSSLPAVRTLQPNGDILASLTQSPLIDGAANGCLSKIIMAVESIRRSEPARAGELFHASLAENHTVASGWLGLAYLEALNAGRRRDALETLRYSLNHAARVCPHQDVVNDSCAQILSTAATNAALLAGRSFDSYANQFTEGIRNMQASGRSSSARNGAIIVGTAAAVLAHRSQGTISKTIGYSVAARSAFGAVDSHINAHRQEQQAHENARLAAQARQTALVAAYASFQCLKEAARLYARASAYTQSGLTSAAESVSGVLAGCCTLELRSFGFHLHELSGLVHNPAFVRSHPEGTPHLLSFTKFARDFGLEQLPFCRSAANLFPDLNRLYEDPALGKAQRRAILRRRLLSMLGILICLVGVSLAVASPATPQILSEFAQMDAPPPTILVTLAIGVGIFIGGVVRMITASRSRLPIELAVTARFDQTWQSFHATTIGPHHFHPTATLRR